MVEGTYPEHEKLSSRKEEHQHIVRFCWFLQSTGLIRKTMKFKDEDGEYLYTYPVMNDSEIAIVIGEYLGIDPDLLEKEKREILEQICKQNQK